MKKMIAALLGITGVLALSGAELMLEDFKEIKPNSWVPFRGGAIRKAEKGAIVRLPGMITKRIPGTWRNRKDWAEKYNGLAFRIKAITPSRDYGCITLCVGAHTFQFYFPLKKTQWVEYRVHFRDFASYSTGGLVLGGEKKGNITIDGLERLRFGDRWTIWHNNAKRTPTEYLVADVRLISDAKVRLSSGKYKVASFKDFQKRLKTGKKVSILCLGDSITAGTAVRNPDVNRYAAQTHRMLRETHKLTRASVKSLAVGGALAVDVDSWIDRDFEEIPDLVTLLVGGNDKSSCFHREAYREILERWIGRMAAKTQGKTALMLITPIPGNGPRYYSQDDFADVVREVAKKYDVPCLDMNKVFRAMPKTQFFSLLADTFHPNAAGQKIFAENLVKLLLK